MMKFSAIWQAHWECACNGKDSQKLNQIASVTHSIPFRFPPDFDLIVRNDAGAALEELVGPIATLGTPSGRELVRDLGKEIPACCDCLVIRKFELHDCCFEDPPHHAVYVEPPVPRLY